MLKRSKQFVVANWRFLVFAVIGGYVTLQGAAILWLLVEADLRPELANIGQMIVSIETNFFANNFLTWRDRRERTLWSRWKRFHAAKIGTVVLNSLLFAALVWLKIPYMLVYMINVAIFTMINFLINEKFVFRKEGA